MISDGEIQQVSSEETSEGGTAGLSESDVTMLGEVLESALGEQTQELKGAIEDEVSSLDASVGATVSEVVPVAVKSALRDGSSTVQVVELSEEQWGEIHNYMELQSQSITLQNALLLFTLVFSCALVGMRVFSEFSRGFRRG